MAPDLLFTTTLRNDYEIFLDEDGNYPVVNIDGHGTRHEDLISSELADWLKNRLQGLEVGIAEASSALSAAPARMGLPYTYGHKLDYYAQKVMLVLVARRPPAYDC